MSRRLVVWPVARLEVAEASDWYESNGTGLGDKFIRSFEGASAAILANPFQYQLVSDKARRAPLRPFPHGLIYLVTDEEIAIVACVHGRRDPRRWQGRIPE